MFEKINSNIIRFFKNPVVYKTIIWFAVLIFIFFEVIAPLLGIWSPLKPSMIDAWLVK